MAYPRIGGVAAVLCVSFFMLCNISYAFTLHTTDDTYINLNKPNQNNGQAEKIVIRNTGTVGERQAFVKFDLSALPAEAEVSQAVLRLWVDKLQNPGSLELREVLATWDEATLSAGTAPVLSQAFSTISIPDDKDSFVTIDLTSVVQGWLTNPSTNHGIALLPNSDDPLRLELDSKEDLATSHPMELEVALVSGGEPGQPGPQGDPGPQGLQGETGLQGVQGPSGTQGLPGQPGVDGFPGMDGSKWLTGSGGPDSALGNIGDFYLDSASGDYYEKTNPSTWVLANNLQGPEGSTGADGVPGAQGDPGPVGERGLQGIQGNTGPQGPIGLTGLQGVIGPPGADGEPGIDGITWLTGTDLPSSAQGSIGDFYLESDTGDYFKKTNPTTWLLVGNLQGLQGEAGLDGTQGQQGDPGLTGAQGLQGVPGVQGQLGSTGPQGEPGRTGPQGIPGSHSLAGKICPTGQVLVGFSILGTILCATSSAANTQFECPTLSTICPIKFTNDPNVNLPLIGSTVMNVRGYVTAIFNNDLVFIQEDGSGPWSGIALESNGIGIQFFQDQEILVSGIVEESDSLTQIGVNSVLALGSASIPPLSLATSAVGNEQFEGVLVRVTNIRVVEVLDSLRFVVNVNPPENPFDASKNVTINLGLTSLPLPNVDDAYLEIIGIVSSTQFGIAIYPRGPLDLVGSR